MTAQKLNALNIPNEPMVSDIKSHERFYMDSTNSLQLFEALNMELDTRSPFSLYMDKPKKTGRPKSYKVEKTPPISATGMRHCVFCNGQVRPQMCSGNKHRWRCVAKKCRKWYGWVNPSDEIPKDLGKKGR
jgi:hypothetical protein